MASLSAGLLVVFGRYAVLRILIIRLVMPLAMALLMAMGVSAVSSAAEVYPQRPLRLIAASSPGSGVDIVARIVGPQLAAALGQQVVIDNRAGAGGNIGAAIAARAPADGYTLFIATPAHAISSSVPGNATYDLIRDFAPITQLTSGHYLFVVHPRVAAHSVQEFIALARARPGHYSFASAGTGNATYLAAELFSILAQTKVLHVPYKGGGPARTELLGGQVDFMFHNITAVLGDVKVGRLRGLAVTGPRRALAAPEIPTVAESGLPGYAITSWFGAMAPRSTSPAILSRLHAEFGRLLQKPEIVERLSGLGAEPAYGTPQQFSTHLQREHELWGRLIRQSGIKLE